MSNEAFAWLQQYQVSPETGFLPSVPPLQALERDFAAWERVAIALPELIQSRQLDEAVLSLPPFPPPPTDQRALERAMQLLSFLSHAWLRSNGQDRKQLPKKLAQPWDAVAQALGRPPVLAHASLVLYNWRKRDPAGPFSFENLTTLFRFHDTTDEAGFVLATTAMEIVSVPAWSAVALLREAVRQQNVSQAEIQLGVILQTIERLQQTFELMRQHCQPTVFYQELRPYLGSLQAVQYEGSEPLVRNYDGGSAAQSAIFQTLDAVLGVVPKRPSTRQFLVRMRQYMPRPHAQLITDLEQENQIPHFCAQHSALATVSNACLEALTRFRTEHLKIVAEYIVGPARTEQITGTGGTSPVPFLKSVRKATHEARSDH